jgi:hypothetical protein
VQEPPDANTDAERRGPDRATDRRVFDRQRGDRICGRKHVGDLRMDGAAVGEPGVHGTEQKAPGSYLEVCQQGNGIEPATDHAAGPRLRTNGHGGTEGKLAEPVSGEVHGAGCDVAGGCRPTTKGSADRPRNAFCGANTKSMTRRNMRVWPGSRCRKFTTCAPA